MQIFRFPLIVGALVSTCLAQQPPSPAELAQKPVEGLVQQAASFAPMSDTWNATAGYQWRQMGSVNVRSGSHAAKSNLPWMAGRGSTGTQNTANGSSSSILSSNDGTASIGAADANGDRTYSGGFVKMDAGTPTFGDTWNWGYQSSSQIQGGNLTFQASTTATSTAMNTTSSLISSSTSASRSWSSLANDAGWNSDLSGSGWFAKVESPAIFRGGPIMISFELGYSFVNSGVSNSSSNVFSAHQETVQHSSLQGQTDTQTVFTTNSNTVTDTYDISGLGVVPGAPYTGSFAGPGPLIPNNPKSRQTITNTSTNSVVGNSSESVLLDSSSTINIADFTSQVFESVDVDLHTISVGPHYSWEWKRVRLGLSTGLGINVVDWDANYQEDLFVSQNGGRSQLLTSYKAHESGAEVKPGFYLEANVQCRVARRIAVFAGGRYDWVGTLDANVGPSRISLDLGGWTAAGGITFSF